MRKFTTMLKERLERFKKRKMSIGEQIKRRIRLDELAATKLARTRPNLKVTQAKT